MPTYTFAGQYGPEYPIAQNATTKALVLPSSCAVYNVGTSTLATLYSNRTKSSGTNPLPTGQTVGTAGIDTAGNIMFFAAPGYYEILISGAGPKQLVHVDPDPADVPNVSTDLKDVDYSALANDGKRYLLYRDYATGKVLLGAERSVAPTSLSVLTDGPTGTPASGDLLAWNSLTSHWEPIHQSAIAGGGGGSDNSISGLIFQGSPTTGAQFEAGLRAPTSTVCTSITCVSVGAASGTSTTISWYVRGPSTSYGLSTAVATTTFTVAAGVTPHTATSTGLTIPLQQFDSLVPKVTTAGTTVPTDITAFLTFDPTATPPTQAPAPTAVTASISGQPDGTALITWTANTVPAGQAQVQYNIRSSNGDTATQAWGTNSVVMSGLANVSMTFTVTPVTAVSGTNITGLTSANSNAVTPTAAPSTGRTTTAEAQGQGWNLDTGSGTVAYDATTTLALTNSLTTTSGSPNVTGTGFTPVHNGMTVTRTGVPAATTFTYLTSTTGTLSHNATTSATSNATFAWSTITGSLKVTATGTPAPIEFIQTASKPMANNETGKVIMMLVYNPTASTIVAGMWLAAFDGSNFIRQTSTPVFQTNVAAGQTLAYQTTESVTDSLITNGKLYGQFIPNSSGDVCYFSTMYWQS